MCDCGISSSYMLFKVKQIDIQLRCIYPLPNYDHTIMQLHQFSMITVPASCTFCIKRSMFFIKKVLSMIMKPVFTNLQAPITLAPILRCLTKVPLTHCMLEIPKWGIWEKMKSQMICHIKLHFIKVPFFSGQNILDI